jgi:hypothetical protein
MNRLLSNYLAEVIRHIRLLVKGAHCMCPSPVSQNVKVATRVCNTGKLLCFLCFLTPHPRKRRDVGRAQEALAERVVSVLQVFEACQRIVGVVVALLDVEALSDHVLRLVSRLPVCLLSPGLSYQAMQLMKHVKLDNVLSWFSRDRDCLVDKFGSRLARNTADADFMASSN